MFSDPITDPSGLIRHAVTLQFGPIGPMQFNS